eukprot:1709112-Amphidinium_carterae.1
MSLSWWEALDVVHPRTIPVELRNLEVNELGFVQNALSAIVRSLTCTGTYSNSNIIMMIMWAGAQRSQVTSMGKRVVPRGSVGLSACALNSFGTPYGGNAGAIATTIHEVSSRHVWTCLRPCAVAMYATLLSPDKGSWKPPGGYQGLGARSEPLSLQEAGSWLPPGQRPLPASPLPLRRHHLQDQNLLNALVFLYPTTSGIQMLRK